MGVVVATIVPAAGADVVYVNAGLTTGADDGSSWENAFQGAGGLATAITASAAGDEIWVAQGVYIPTTTGSRFVSFFLRNGVEVYGGFAGDEEHRHERDIAAHETVLSGDLNGDDDTVGNFENSFNVVDGNGSNATAVLDGFVITGGNANGGNPNDRGGGIILLNSSPTLRHCHVIDNRCTFGGGAMYFNNSSPTIFGCVFEANNGGAFGGAWDAFNNSSPSVTDCMFRDNTAQRAGGVEVFGNCNPVFTRCVFDNNTATSSPGGGGMYLAQGGLTRVNDCLFIGNAALRGAGMYNDGVSPQINRTMFFNNQTSGAAGQGGGIYNATNAGPQIRDSLFAGNQARTGGAIRNLTNANATIINTTIVGNVATNDGGGIANVNNAPSVTSSVLWANSDLISGMGTAAQILDGGSAATTVRFSDIMGGWSGAGTGNIDQDPQFIDEAAGDYALAPGSPCIDTGDPNFVPPIGATDLQGHARVLCDEVDMGAYEYGFGDADCDGDQDLDDYEAFLDCETGPGGGTPAECSPFDAESDSDVDAADFKAFQLVFDAP